jgi:DNA-directed RNA polymerase subunit RPC12/RpoP
MEVGIVMGSDEENLDAPVQVASIQTLQRRGFSHVGRPDFAIVDECHQFHDATKKIIQEVWPSTRFLGFTATPVGPGGSRIDHFEEIVEPVKNSTLIADGHLLSVHPYLAPSEPDLGGINLRTVSQDELGQRVQACTIYGDVFKIWQPYSHLQTMVVLPSRAVCNQFHKIAVSRGITAKIVDGTTPQNERNSTFNEFKEADCQMLLGVDVIREGLDLPIAQCLIDLHPTHQMRTYWQTVGRVKRPHPGQETAVVIDLAGNLWRHMVHPDQDPPWQELTKDNTIEEVIERKAGIRCPECGSKDFYGPNGGLYKCEDCGHTWAKKNPWVCPHCKQRLAPYQKVIGGICPNCSQKVGKKQTRQIRMADGSIRSIPADEIKRRKKSKADGEQAAWLKWVFIANGWNNKPENHGKPPKTLTWCGAMFKRERGHWPREGLKYMPVRESADWKRAPGSVFPHLRKGRHADSSEQGQSRSESEQVGAEAAS